MKKLASKAYTDVSGTDNTSLMAAFNAYYNLLEDNTDPSAFNGTQSLTREQFSALVYKATTPVSQDYLVGFNGADDPFTVQVGGLTDYTAIAKQLDTYAFINAADGCLDGNTIKGSITRAEAAYIVVNAHFQEQLEALTGKEKSSYKDVKNGGDLALKANFKSKDKATKAITVKPRWQTYTLQFMLENPDKGMQEELYKAMVVAGNLELLPAVADNQSRWDEPLSKSEAIELVINIGLAQNKLYGYGSDSEFGDKIVPVPIDEPESSDGIRIPVNHEVYITDPITGETITYSMQRL